MWTAQVEPIAQKVLAGACGRNVTCLILGATDTGKTTFAMTLARRLTAARSVAVVDADVGQSHIGPPGTVAWALVENRHTDLCEDIRLSSVEALAVRGMGFVGDITPSRHLLQLTAAIAKCCQQACESADVTIVDTPGFVRGPAACALWWTVQQILQPGFILALQRENELSEILAGLPPCLAAASFCEAKRRGAAGLGTLSGRIELIKAPSEIPVKSPQKRQSYRRSRFEAYFADSRLYNIQPGEIAMQICGSRRPASLAHRLVSLRDGQGCELAIGVIVNYDAGGKVVSVRAPKIDATRIRCLVVGDAIVDIAG